jgi:hypothetical protein
MAAMKLPRVPCPVCGRTVAATPIAAVGLGAVDHKRESRRLVLCEGSMQRIPLPGHLTWQQELAQPDQSAAPAAVQESLFQ